MHIYFPCIVSPYFFFRPAKGLLLFEYVLCGNSPLYSETHPTTNQIYKTELIATILQRDIG